MNSRYIKLYMIIIIFLMIILILINNKNKNNNNKIEKIDPHINYNSTYDFINDRIMTLQEEKMCIKDECKKTCNYVSLPEDLIFNTPEKIRDYIEEFFILYLNVLDIGCINNKIKKYIGNELSIGKIFKLKNLTINSFSPLTNILLDNIFFVNNIESDRRDTTGYGIFKLMKNKFNSILNKYKIQYKSDYIKLIQRVDEITNNNTINEIENINDCSGSQCVIYIETICFDDIIKRLSQYGNIELEKIREDLWLNKDILIELCQMSIVIDLFLKYYEINLSNLSNLTNIMNIHINKYNILRENIMENIKKIKSKNYSNADFKRYISLNI